MLNILERVKSLLYNNANMIAEFFCYFRLFLARGADVDLENNKGEIPAKVRTLQDISETRFSCLNSQCLITCEMGDLNLSLVVRKPVLGVFDQVRHKPGCTATEDG